MNNRDVRVSSEKIATTHIELERVLNDRLHRSNQVVIFPTLEKGSPNYDGILFSKKLNDILVLILVYHFSDYFGLFKEYIRYEIEQYLYKNMLAPELVASLVDKRICLEVLLALNYSTRMIFSLITESNIRKVLSELHFLFQYPRKVVRPVFRRGYNDKGSLRAESSVLIEPDSEAQFFLETQRQLYSDCVDLIVREVGGWVLQDLSNNFEN